MVVAAATRRQSRASIVAGPYIARKVSGKLENTATQKGGSFFLQETAPEDVFTPEDFGEHHEMLARTTERFVKNEVAPHVETLEHKDFDLMRSLMRQAGELGLLGADIEEKRGGET